jgi:hypothetical protein
VSTQPALSEYMMLIRNTTWCEGHSAEEIQKFLRQFNAWVERLSQDGKVKGGHPLAFVGKTISAKKAVTDAPLAESKEAIAGFIVIRASNLGEATEIAKNAPCLDYGQTLEIREIVPEPYELQIARQTLAKTNIIT